MLSSRLPWLKMHILITRERLIVDMVTERNYDCSPRSSSLGRSGRHWGHSAEAKIPLNSKACIDGRWEEWLLERLLGDSCISTFPPATFKSFGCSLVHFNVKQTLRTERDTFNHFLNLAVLIIIFTILVFFYCSARTTMKRFIIMQILSILQSTETSFDCQRNIFKGLARP